MDRPEYIGVVGSGDCSNSIYGLARDLGFEIGKKGKSYIAKRYSPDLDEHIRRFLEYKGAKKLFPFVVKRLRHIQEETRKIGTNG